MIDNLIIYQDILHTHVNALKKNSYDTAIRRFRRLKSRL